MQNTSNEPLLRFCDDPMFKRVMERESICKGVLERILGRPIGKIAYNNTEQERRMGPNGKAIRMDAYLVESSGHIYDVEMQMAHNPLLPLRFRGYQSVLDGSFLKRGASYSELRGSYVIFICMNDPFGAELPVYTIERTCLEQPNIQFNCKAHWIALNASAWHYLDNDDELGLLLRYVYTGEIGENDNLLESIDAEVAHNNADKEWVMTMIDSISIAEEEAMIRGRLKGIEEGRAQGLAEGRAKGLIEGIAEGKAEGIAEGKAEGIAEGKAEGIAAGKIEGEKRYIKLVEKLFELNRTEDIKLANSNSEVRQKLYKEFNI